MGILIQGGRIVDAATVTDKKGDIYLEDGVITEIGEKLKIKDNGDRVIDAKGSILAFLLLQAPSKPSNMTPAISFFIILISL